MRLCCTKAVLIERVINRHVVGIYGLGDPVLLKWVALDRGDRIVKRAVLRSFVNAYTVNDLF